MIKCWEEFSKAFSKLYIFHVKINAGIRFGETVLNHPPYEDNLILCSRGLCLTFYIFGSVFNELPSLQSYDHVYIELIMGVFVLLYIYIYINPFRKITS